MKRTEIARLNKGILCTKIVNSVTLVRIYRNIVQMTGPLIVGESGNIAS